MSKSHWEFTVHIGPYTIRIPKNLVKGFLFLFLIGSMNYAFFLLGTHNCKKNDPVFLTEPTPIPHVPIDEELQQAVEKRWKELEDDGVNLATIKNKRAQIEAWNNDKSNSERHFPDKCSPSEEVRLLYLKATNAGSPYDLKNYLGDRAFTESVFDKALQLCNQGKYNEALRLLDKVVDPRYPDGATGLCFKIDDDDIGTEARINYLRYKIYANIQPYIYPDDQKIAWAKVDSNYSSYLVWSSVNRDIDFPEDTPEEEWISVMEQQRQWPEMGPWKDRVDANAKHFCTDCGEKGKTGWGKIHQSVW